MIRTFAAGLPAGVPLALTSWFIMNGIRTAFAVLFPTIATEPGWSESELAATFSIGILLYAPATIAVGFLLDRIGIRLTMLIGCMLMTLSFGLVATATPDAPWRMVAGWTIAAGPAAASIGYTPIVKLLATLAPQQLGRAMGISMIGQGLSPLLIGPALQAIALGQNWRMAVLAYAGFGLAVLVPLILKIAPGRPLPSSTIEAAFSVRHTLRQGEFWLFLLAFVCLGYMLLIPTYLVAFIIVLGLSPYLAAILAGVFGALNSVGSVAAGWLTDRLGPLPVLAGGVVVLVVGTLALLGLIPSLPWMLAWFILFTGLGRGVFGLTVAVAQAKSFAGAHLGRVTGILDVGFSIGASLGIWLTAVGRDELGSFVPGYASAMAAAAAMFGFTCLAVATVRSKRGVTM